MKLNKFEDLVQKQPSKKEQADIQEDLWIEKELFEKDKFFREHKILQEERRQQVHLDLVKSSPFLKFAEFAQTKGASYNDSIYASSF